jgi:hypothetical protein
MAFWVLLVALICGALSPPSKQQWVQQLLQKERSYLWQSRQQGMVLVQSVTLSEFKIFLASVAAGMLACLFVFPLGSPSPSSPGRRRMIWNAVSPTSKWLLGWMTMVLLNYNLLLCLSEQEVADTTLSTRIVELMPQQPYLSDDALTGYLQYLMLPRQR